MSIDVKINDIYNSVIQPYTNVDGSWRECKTVHSNVGGNWKLVWWKPLEPLWRFETAFDYGPIFVPDNRSCVIGYTTATPYARKLVKLNFDTGALISALDATSVMSFGHDGNTFITLISNRLCKLDTNFNIIAQSEVLENAYLPSNIFVYGNKVFSVSSRYLQVRALSNLALIANVALTDESTVYSSSILCAVNDVVIVTKSSSNVKLYNANTYALIPTSAFTNYNLVGVDKYGYLYGVYNGTTITKFSVSTSAITPIYSTSIRGSYYSISNFHVHPDGDMVYMEGSYGTGQVDFVKCSILNGVYKQLGIVLNRDRMIYGKVSNEFIFVGSRGITKFYS